MHLCVYLLTKQSLSHYMFRVMCKHVDKINLKITVHQKINQPSLIFFQSHEAKSCPFLLHHF